MSRISGHKTPHAAFTLTEVIVASSMSTIVFAGILSAVLFLGRNATRLMNLQQQDVQGRRALHLFTEDLSAAIQLTASTSSQVRFTKPTSTGTTTVAYIYSSATGNLLRTEGPSTQVVLSGLTSCAVTYFNEGGAAVAGSPQSVKSVELAFSSSAGTASNGTRASSSLVSPRILLRNKPPLQ